MTTNEEKVKKIFKAVGKAFPADECPNDLLLRLGNYLEKLQNNSAKINTIFFLLKRDRTRKGAFKQKILEDMGDELNVKDSEDEFEKKIVAIYEQNKIQHYGGNSCNFQFTMPSLTAFGSGLLYAVGKAWGMRTVNDVVDTLSRQGVDTMITRSRTSVMQLSGAGTVSLIGKLTSVVPVVLVAIELTFRTLKSIYDWYKGRTTGKECLKTIIDDSVTLCAGAAGAAIGSTAGLAFGPLGMIAGAAIGSAVASTLARNVITWLTSNIFDLTPHHALNNAFAFLKLSPQSSNGEINSRYRHLCRIYHPDKSGGAYAEEWEKLQYSMAVIKASKEE